MSSSIPIGLLWHCVAQSTPACIWAWCSAWLPTYTAPVLRDHNTYWDTDHTYRSTTWPDYYLLCIYVAWATYMGCYTGMQTGTQWVCKTTNTYAATIPRDYNTYWVMEYTYWTTTWRDYCLLYSGASCTTHITTNSLRKQPCTHGMSNTTNTCDAPVVHAWDPQEPRTHTYSTSTTHHYYMWWCCVMWPAHIEVFICVLRKYWVFCTHFHPYPFWYASRTCHHTTNCSDYTYMLVSNALTRQTHITYVSWAQTVTCMFGQIWGFGRSSCSSRRVPSLNSQKVASW
jgi:hypothetical protein